MRQIRLEEPGMKQECLEKMRWDGPQALPLPLEDCFQFDAPRRWTGRWFIAFEVSRFCPDTARQCSLQEPGEWIWLTTAPSVSLPQYKGPQALISAFKVDFIGRKSTYPGGYGHMESADQEIIIDRMISMKRVGPPPGQLTKAQMVQYWGNCEAERTCIPNWGEINKIKE